MPQQRDHFSLHLPKKTGTLLWFNLFQVLVTPHPKKKSASNRPQMFSGGWGTSSHSKHDSEDLEDAAPVS